MILFKVIETFNLDRHKKNFNCKKDHKSNLKHKLKYERQSLNKEELIPNMTDIVPYYDHLIGIENRPYIGWKQECLHNKHSTPNKIELLYENYKKIFENKQKVTIIYIIFTVATFFLLIYYFSARLDIKNTSQYYYLIINAILFILILVPLIYFNISIYLTVINDKQSVDSFKCSDDFNNEKLSQIKSNLISLCIIDSSLFFLLILNLLISTVFLICHKNSINSDN